MVNVERPILVKNKRRVTILVNFRPRMNLYQWHDKTIVSFHTDWTIYPRVETLFFSQPKSFTFQKVKQERLFQKKKIIHLNGNIFSKNTSVISTFIRGNAKYINRNRPFAFFNRQM